MTTLIDGTGLQDLPIFAALQDLLTQPPTELIETLPPAMPTAQPAALSRTDACAAA